MRTLLVLSAFALFILSSCSNVDQFKAPIESLSAEWDSTTTTVTDFVGTLQSTQQELQNQFAGMQVPEGLTLSEESADQVAQLKDSYQEELGSLSELSQNVSSFVSDWQTKAEQLTQLKDGLTSGNLGADAMGTIESLKSTVSEALSGLDSWKGELEDIRSNTGDIAEQFNALIANLQGN